MTSKTNTTDHNAQCKVYNQMKALQVTETTELVNAKLHQAILKTSQQYLGSFPVKLLSSHAELTST
jgi:hypothetical protein